MKDPYEILGVARSATDKEIKDAFKKLARKFHPDLHPGDKTAEEKFKAISGANDLLKDKEKRRRFDAGEIDASGAEKPQQRYYRDFADGPGYDLARSARMALPATRIWRISWRALLGPGRDGRRAHSGRAGRMSVMCCRSASWTQPMAPFAQLHCPRARR